MRDPALALRLAVRSNDVAKVQALLEFLLRRVPLTYNPNSKVVAGDGLLTVSIIRGEVDSSTDGLPIQLDSSHIVRGILRADDALGLSVGDRIVLVDDAPLQAPLTEVVAPESVAVLKVWKRGAMAGTRARLARNTIDSALLEAAMAPGEGQQSVYAHAGEGHERDATIVIVDKLLRARASVRTHDEHGWSPLHHAAYRGKAALCAFLLERGAPIEGPSANPPAEYTPLQLAVIGGHGALVRRLLVAQADPFATATGGRQLIHLAALAPCAELVELLCDPSPSDGGRQKLDTLSGHGWSALFLAAGADNLPMVKALLGLGAPLGQVLHGRTLLHHSARCGASSVVQWLGTEFSAQLPLEGRDRKGRTPLDLAACGSHLRAVEVLVALGAAPVHDAALLSDVRVSDEVRLLLGTASRQWRRTRSDLLLRAAAAGDVRAMSTLHLDQGADPLHVDERGYSSLHLAAAAGHEDATLYLLQTPSGPHLASWSTQDAGASSNWRAEDLAMTPRIRSFIEDFGKGDDERNRVIAHARRRLAPILQEKAIASAKWAADVYAAAHANTAHAPPSAVASEAVSI